MIKVSKKDFIVLDQIFYIYYLIQFKKNKVQALIDFGNKVNIMTPKYVSKLDLKICLSNVKVQKIDGFIVNIFKIVLASFQIENKLRKSSFF